MAMAKVPILRIFGQPQFGCDAFNCRRRTSMDDQVVTPFRIDVPQRELDDLRHRLERTRWSEPPNGPDYGVPFAYIRRLADRWLDGYDWRAWEARLNACPQFETTIDG